MANRSNSLARVEGMVFNEPLLILPSKAEVICAYLNQRLYGISAQTLDHTAIAAAQLDISDDDQEEGSEPPKPYAVVGPVAVISVVGETVKRKGGMDALSGLMSYQKYTEMHSAAMADPFVRGIMTIFDSPGGSVAGLKVCADQIIAGNRRNGGKPHMAVIDESCFSAAYWMAASHDWIVAPEHAMGGSIGACMMMLDRSKMLADEGLKPIMLRSHDRKNRGNGLEPIDDETISRMQTIVDAIGADFCDHVGAQRGIPADMIAATEAEIFRAGELLELGLIDQIGTADQAFEALLRAI